jgi:glutathione S-transferase
MLELEAVADGVGDAGALTVQEGWRREDARSAVWLARQRHKIESGLRFLDHALPGAAGTAGGGDTPSLFDLAAASACGFVRFWLKDLDLPALAPALAARCAVLEQRPGWAATAPVLVPGAGVPAL